MRRVYEIAQLEVATSNEQRIKHKKNVQARIRAVYVVKIVDIEMEE